MTREQIKRITEKIAANNGAQDSIDDVVHDIFSGMASDINNSGIKNQVEFLLGQGYTEEQILKFLG
jgi:ribulose bisphosphate carboxylase small subunit